MLKSIKLSDFIKIPSSPFILGALISRIMTFKENDKNYFYAYTSFRASKFVHYSQFDLVKYSKELIKKLNFYSHYDNWSEHKVEKTSVELRFYILDDVGMSKKAFYKFIYQRIVSSAWILNQSEKDMYECMRGFMELRGSVDTSLKLIAQDYFYDDSNELKKAQILTQLLNIPISYANFNARDLQPQFVNGTNKRNTQFRIKLYFYANKIGFLNDYKAKIFETAYNEHSKDIIGGITYFKVTLPNENNDVTFLKYINFFTNNIYQRQLTPQAITQLRNELKFNSDSTSSNGRNKAIIDLYDKISEDKCAICGTTQTYFSQSKGKQYFEIHHVIPYYNDNQLDNIANLVKLCPNCHRMLKKGSGTKEEQILAITKILHEHSEVYEFASSYLGIDNINELAKKIQTMLG